MADTPSDDSATVTLTLDPSPRHSHSNSLGNAWAEERDHIAGQIAFFQVSMLLTCVADSFLCAG